MEQGARRRSCTEELVGDVTKSASSGWKISFAADEAAPDDDAGGGGKVFPGKFLLRTQHLCLDG